MQLFILLAIALVVGYLIARSRWSKNIDETASKATESSVSLTKKATDLVHGESSGEPQTEEVEEEAGAEGTTPQE